LILDAGPDRGLGLGNIKVDRRGGKHRKMFAEAGARRGTIWGLHFLEEFAAGGRLSGGYEDIVLTDGDRRCMGGGRSIRRGGR
jgi:hypothetical protein